jgi:hypothetical protein
MEKKRLKKLPKFKSEDEERKFWASHESSDYVDWSRAEVIREPNVFPNLKKTDWSKRLIILPETLQKKLQKIAEGEKITAQHLAERFIREGMKRAVAR